MQKEKKLTREDLKPYYMNYTHISCIELYSEEEIDDLPYHNRGDKLIWLSAEEDKKNQKIVKDFYKFQEKLERLFFKDK